MPLIDLSHTIEDGLETYKGLPAPLICDYLEREASRENYEEGTEFQIGMIAMVGNSGTYIDCPFHRYAEGRDCSQLPLEKFASLPAVKVVHNYQEHGLAVNASAFQGLEIRGKAVLVQTNWDKHWNTEAYYANHPFLTEEAAAFLQGAGAKMVGIDSYNIDDTRGDRRPVHTILLGHEILIVEHMTNLNALPETNFRFSAVPPKVKGMGSFPVRAFAETQ